MKRAFLLVLLAFGFSLSAHSEYQIIDLMIPNAGYHDYKTLSINNNSQVCGFFCTEKGHRKPFLLDPQSGLQEIEVEWPNGPLKLNNNGVVAGSCDIRDEKGMYKGCAIFLWSRENGFKQIVNTSSPSRILSLNDSNQVIYATGNSFRNSKLFLWDNGFSNDISDLFCDSAINNKGEMFGYNPNTCWLEFYNSKEGTFEKMLFFKGECYVLALTDTGIAAGKLWGMPLEYGFRWSREKGMELLEGFQPTAIGANGEMFGIGADGWLAFEKNGEIVNFNNYLGLAFDPSTPWVFISAITSINDKGEIVGTAHKDYRLSNPHAVLIKKRPS